MKIYQIFCQTREKIYNLASIIRYQIFCRLLNRCYYCLWRKATWWYGPNEFKADACDECVPRGCDCNYNYSKEEEWSDPPPPLDRIDWKWVDEEKGVWTFVDEKGREYPCCEWFHY